MDSLWNQQEIGASSSWQGLKGLEQPWAEGPSGWQPEDSLESDIDLGDSFGFGNSLWSGKGKSSSVMVRGDVHSMMSDVGRAEEHDESFWSNMGGYISHTPQQAIPAAPSDEIRPATLWQYNEPVPEINIVEHGVGHFQSPRDPVSTSSDNSSLSSFDEPPVTPEDALMNFYTPGMAIDTTFDTTFGYLPVAAAVEPCLTMGQFSSFSYSTPPQVTNFGPTIGSEENVFSGYSVGNGSSYNLEELANPYQLPKEHLGHAQSESQPQISSSSFLSMWDNMFPTAHPGDSSLRRNDPPHNSPSSSSPPMTSSSDTGSALPKSSCPSRAHNTLDSSWASPFQAFMTSLSLSVSDNPDTIPAMTAPPSPDGEGSYAERIREQKKSKPKEVFTCPSAPGHPKCDKIFPRKHDATRHADIEEQKAAGIYHYPCRRRKCSKKFRREDKMKDHMWKVHRIKTITEGVYYGSDMKGRLLDAFGRVI